MRKTAFLLFLMCLVFSGTVFADYEMGVKKKSKDITIVPGGSSIEDVLTAEEARQMALELEPGRIIKVRESKSPLANTIYEYEIQTDNGVVMLVKINTMTHRVIEHKVIKTGSYGKVRISEREAVHIATVYVKKEHDNYTGLVSFTKKMALKIIGGKPLYEAHALVEKERFDFYVDAMTGEIIPFL